MPIEKLRPSFSFDEERIKQLKQIVPEAFADNQINWEVLKEALGNYLEDDEGDVEHFGLFWPGKREARRIASIPSKGTLIPVYGEGLKPDGTPDTDGKNDSRNIFIEGENLEVLKILQKSYAGRIKMIYIDPPYNTGNDFVYDDDFTEPLEEYLRRTGQIDEQGKPLTTNKKSDGRFHSRWLSMMYPRLKLARNLLRDDGVIFVSIDDNEVHNLRQVMNEIFGEENFLVNLIWKSGRTSSGHYTVEHEYIVGYCKTKEGFKYYDFHGDEVISDRAIKRPSKKNPVSDITFPAGMDFLCEDKKFPKRFGTNEPIEVIEGILEAKDKKLKNSVTLRAAWTMRDMILSWLKGEKVIDQKGQIVEKFFFKQNGVLQYQKKKSTTHPKSIIEGITTKNGTNEIISLFGEQVFNFPKPTRLIVDLISPVILKTGEICLDFFAGSGTLGEAIYQINSSDKDTSAQFILVQLPEPLDENDDIGKAGLKLGYGTIADVCLARVKLSTENYKEKNISDLGIKAYKLGYSNYKIWKSYEGKNVNELESLFESVESPLIENWDYSTLITEIILIEGFPLDSKIEEIKEYDKNKVQQVTSDFCEHKLLICLDKKVHSETIKNLQLGDTDIFICLDTAITDEEKVTLADKGLIKTI